MSVYRVHVPATEFEPDMDVDFGAQVERYVKHKSFLMVECHKKPRDKDLDQGVTFVTLSED